MRIILSIGLLLLFFTSCQDDAKLKSSDRGFDKAKLSSLNESEQFDYAREIDTSVNPVLQFLGRLLTGIALLFGNYIGYIILVVLVVLLIWLVVKNYNPWSSSSNQNEASIIVIPKEHISDHDYNKLLKLALENADYRLAIRFSFLNSLKALQESKLIHWNKDKTNHQYIREIPEQYKKDFVQMVNVYEWVWYGQFQANAEVYQQMYSISEVFIQKIRRPK